MPSVGRREPFRGRENGLNPAEIRTDLDLATLRAAARSVHRGAWWRAARRDGWHRAPGVAKFAGILVLLSCLAVGGLVYLSGPLGLFRGGDMIVGVAQHDGGRAGSRSPSGTENDAMRAMKMSAAAAVVALWSAGFASGQSPVEWKVSEGGNGHWYQTVLGVHLWTEAQFRAEAIGGHLATFGSSAERVWCFQRTLDVSGSWKSVVVGSATRAVGPWVGGKQAAGSTEPSGGWSWVDGTPWTYPNAGFDLNNASACGANEDRLSFWGDGFPMNATTAYVVSDFPGRGFCEEGVGPVSSYLVEWDADCNGDGIVDYGQIVSGELSDENGNNIPDCCEQGTDCPVSVAINGSFEAGTPLNACTSETITSGTALGTGWMVNAGSVQRVRASSSCNTQGAPKFGDFFVDLLDAGEIRQSIATTPGKSYRLTFWLSGDCAGGPATKRVTASLGSATQTFDHACVGSAVQAWRSCTLEFIANSAITNLSLKSLAGGSSNGPLIDGVRVEDISISCAGDVDGDGEVTGSDIGLVLLNFGPCPQ